MFGDTEPARELVKKWKKRERERNGDDKCLEAAGFNRKQHD